MKNLWCFLIFFLTAPAFAVVVKLDDQFYCIEHVEGFGSAYCRPVFKPTIQMLVDTEATPQWVADVYQGGYVDWTYNASLSMQIDGASDNGLYYGKNTVNYKTDPNSRGNVSVVVSGSSVNVVFQTSVFDANGEEYFASFQRNIGKKLSIDPTSLPDLMSMLELTSEAAYYEGTVYECSYCGYLNVTKAINNAPSAYRGYTKGTKLSLLPEQSTISTPTPAGWILLPTGLALLIRRKHKLPIKNSV